MPERKTLEISWSTLWRILFFIVLVILLYLGRQILLGLLLAIIISSGLEVVVDFLEKHSIPRTLGVILIFLAFAILIVVILYAVVPLLIVDLNTIFSGISKSAQNNIWLSLVDLKSPQSLATVINRLSVGFFSGNVSPLGFISQTVGGFGLAVAVIISSFYLTLSRDGVERFIKAVLPADYEGLALRIYGRSRHKIGSWFRTQIVLSVLVGALVWGALLILGVKHAFLLGVLAAFFEIVPFVGPILSGAAAVLAALTTSAILAAYTLVVFLALHQLESHVLVPLLMRRSVGLHPVIVIIALLMGAEIGGFLSILIAVPVAAVFGEALDEWSSAKKPPMSPVASV